MSYQTSGLGSGGLPAVPGGHASGLRRPARDVPLRSAQRAGAPGGGFDQRPDLTWIRVVLHCFVLCCVI